jgi:hypothetical protein
MSDYNPDPRPDPRFDPRAPYDRYGIDNRFNQTWEPEEGRSTYAVIALLTAVALVGGFLFFASPQPNDQQAEVPRTNTTTPLEQPAPAPSPAQTQGQDQAPTRLPAAPPEGPIQTPPDSVTPTNPQR